MLFRYKPDDGRNARQIAFWGGETVLAFGCSAFAGLLNRSVALREPLTSAMPEVPLLGARFSGSFAIAFAMFVVLSVVWVRFISREGIAQHLIEVETEINKVTWPSFKEASNSSIVVIVTVVILMAFLALSDFLLKMFFDVILWGN